MTPSTSVARSRRRYDSPVRRQQAAETRERILAAGAELLHESAVWNWGALTVRAVARRAGVNERTVYRHFQTERALRDAVLARLEDEARVDLSGLRLEDVRDVSARILEYISTFPIEPRAHGDATMAAAGERLRDALLGALVPATKGWSGPDRATAAAVFDLLWSPAAYERLVGDWGLEPSQAIDGLTWVMDLVEEAVRQGRRP